MKLIKSLAKMHREKIEDKVNEIIPDTDVIVYGESLGEEKEYIIAYRNQKKELYILDYNNHLQYKVINHEPGNINIKDNLLSINVDNKEHDYKIPRLKLNHTINPIIQTSDLELLQAHINYAFQESSHINRDNIYH